jgi:hypothetical protein
MLCRSFRVSFGLVIALAVAILCNIYLVFLLWTGGGQQSDYHYEFTVPPIISQEAPIKIKDSGLNLNYLKAMLNSSTNNVDKTSSSRSVISMMNKLKRELKSRGAKTVDTLGSSSKVNRSFKSCF